MAGSRDPSRLDLRLFLPAREADELEVYDSAALWLPIICHPSSEKTL